MEGGKSWRERAMQRIGGAGAKALGLGGGMKETRVLEQSQKKAQWSQLGLEKERGLELYSTL